MTKYLFAFALCFATAFAQAPASIGGKVYRESTIIVGVRSSSERTIVFGTDGTFSVLKAGAGGALILTAPYQIFLHVPRPDGTYTYIRNGDSTATINFIYGDGTKETKSLTFTNGIGGSDGGTFAFYFSNLAAAQAAPATNVSMRGQVAASHPLIVGFVVPGDASVSAPDIFLPPVGVAPREVLIRVVGPSLSAFGLTGTWADPDFQLYHGSSPASVAEVHYADWCSPNGSIVVPPSPSADTEAAFRKIFNYVGAFPLLSGSKDAADVVRLNPGAYTIVCNAAPGDAGGEALVEVYFLP